MNTYLLEQDDLWTSKLLKKAMRKGGAVQKSQHIDQKELHKEMMFGRKEKLQAQEQRDKKSMDTKVAAMKTEDEFLQEYPELTQQQLYSIMCVIRFECVGWMMEHVWYEKGEGEVTDKGRVSKIKGRGANRKYAVEYWNPLIEDQDQAVVSYLPPSQLICDIICKDLVM
jgi:hypothetical protein